MYIQRRNLLTCVLQIKVGVIRQELNWMDEDSRDGTLDTYRARRFSLSTFTLSFCLSYHRRLLALFNFVFRVSGRVRQSKQSWNSSCSLETLTICRKSRNCNIGLVLGTAATLKLEVSMATEYYVRALQPVSIYVSYSDMAALNTRTL